MNDELIEKVARACCIANDCDPDTIHEGSPIWVNWIDDAKAAIAAMQPHIAAEREDAARRALEAAAVAYQADAETWLQISRRAACARQGAKIIRAIDPSQFREAGNGA